MNIKNAARVPPGTHQRKKNPCRHLACRDFLFLHIPILTEQNTIFLLLYQEKFVPLPPKHQEQTLARVDSPTEQQH